MADLRVRTCSSFSHNVLAFHRDDAKYCFSQARGKSTRHKIEHRTYHANGVDDCGSSPKEHTAWITSPYIENYNYFIKSAEVSWIYCFDKGRQ